MRASYCWLLGALGAFVVALVPFACSPTYEPPPVGVTVSADPKFDQTHSWETVIGGADAPLARCRVPGGWVYKSSPRGLCFVPEPPR